VAEAPKKKRLVVLQDRPPDEEPQPEERPARHWVLGTALISIIAWLLLGGTANFVLQQAGVHGLWTITVVSIATQMIAFGIAAAIAGRLGVHAGRNHATYGTLAAGAFGWALGLSNLLTQGLLVTALTLVIMLTTAWAGGVIGYRLGRRSRKLAPPPPPE
jgi:hypothetical protein